MQPEIKAFLLDCVAARFELTVQEGEAGDVDALKDSYVLLTSERLYAYRTTADIEELWKRIRQDDIAVDIVSEGCSQLYLFLDSLNITWPAFIEKVANAIVAGRWVKPPASTGMFTRDETPSILTDDDYAKHSLTRDAWAKILVTDPWVAYVFLLNMCQFKLAELMFHRPTGPNGGIVNAKPT